MTAVSPKKFRLDPILRKELRLIGPAWIIAMAAPVAWLFLPEAPQASLLIAALAALPLAVASFGQEISLGTFGQLLAQPERRARIWKIKTVLTFLAISVVVFVFAESSRMRVGLWGNGSVRSFYEKLRMPWSYYAAFGLAFFATGFWTTLVFRHVMVACSLTYLIPIGIATYFAGIYSESSSTGQVYEQEAALVIYAIAGFFLARWQFMRAQDTQWFGGAASISARGLASLSGCLLFSYRSRGVFLATVQKEIQMQHPAILAIAAMLILHGGFLILRQSIPVVMNRYPGLNDIWMLWFFVPLISGCIAVAEERQLNTLEGSLSLPMRRSVKFLIKLTAASIIGVALAVGCLRLMARFGGSLWSVPGSFWSWRGISAAFAVICGVSFYVSTLCRNSLQALGAALAFLFGGLITIVACLNALSTLLEDQWKPRILLPFLEWSVLTVIFLVLAYRNFSLLKPNAQDWLKDIVLLLGVYNLIAVLVEWLG